jgi:DNA polymerase-3 subunit alpha (Gram-positive type)
MIQPLPLDKFPDKDTAQKLNDFFSRVTLNKILVNRKKSQWTIEVFSKDSIAKAYISDVESAMLSVVPSLTAVNIKVIPQAFTDDVSIDDIWAEMQRLMIDMEPLCKGWLTTASYNLDEAAGVFTLNIGDEHIVPVLYKRGIDRALGELFEQRTGNKVRIEINDNAMEAAAWRAQVEQERDQLEDEILLEMVKNSNNRGKSTSSENNDKKSCILYGSPISKDSQPINSVAEDSGRVTIEGEVIDISIRDTKNGKKIITFDITDHTSSITVKLFVDTQKATVLLDGLKTGLYVKVRGDCQYDKYQRDLVVMAIDIIQVPAPIRQDTCPEKRVELHLHTQMSAMDAVSKVADLVKRAAYWQHKAIAITDHGVVQAFPEAYEAGRKYGINIIYGVEAYVVDDCVAMVTDADDRPINSDMVVLDIETTGLNAGTDKIIEIGAVRIKDGKYKDEFSSFINPHVPIPPGIVNLTGITDDMVSNAPDEGDVLQRFMEFAGDAVLVAHNAQFDMGFIRQHGQKYNLKFANPVLDTLTLARQLFKGLKHYKLDTLAHHLHIDMDNHHRAVDDARTAAEILFRCMDKLSEMGCQFLSDLNRVFGSSISNNSELYHAVILVKNQGGLKNLYKLISVSHIDYFYRKPRIPKSVLVQYRDNLIIGSGCDAGELYQALIKSAADSVIKDIVAFYDYLEIQPLDNAAHLIKEGKVADRQQLMDINKRIYELGKLFDKPVVATGDVHFLDPHDEYFRRILMHGQGFSDADQQAPLYFKTTDEMLEEFKYLGDDACREVVISNPNAIASMIEFVKPIPDEFYPPHIDRAEEEIQNMALSNALAIYGDPLPPIVKQRLDKELNAIITNGFSVLYLIAQKLVKKSLEDGYLVGSRGSVGSSFVATMCGITEVNPLPPHYVCPHCHYSDFDIDVDEYGCGADLPDKDCPVCGKPLKKDGYDTPFEVFLGFNGDKVPDIDLNFSGEYQPRAHKYTEELFGEGHVFRAGTIATIADKTAYGFVKNYLEEKGLVAHNAEVNRLVKNCTGIKRTTGQHPGGVMVVPKDKDILDFTPIQYPADEKDSGVITTHFDYHSISSRLVKLDILGHDDPTVIRMLEDITGIDAKGIPIGEKTVMKIFSSTEPLGVEPVQIGSEVGTIGIPEFGTRFVRQMLVDTRPTTFAELIRISGLSHGTDVWLNNAQDLIKQGVAKLSEVIATRDDIMLSLIHMGVEPGQAFRIMESVRKGKGLKPEDEQLMHDTGVPQWFIDSCKKIRYMFPKAHAVAYVIMAFRISYFKVYHPEAFYAAYFTVRADEFDADIVSKGPDTVQDSLHEIERKGNNATAKEKNLLTILEVAREMYARGIQVLPVDIAKSQADRFIVTDNGILPPFTALQGVGLNAARNIVAARGQAQFTSIQDLKERAKVSRTVVDIMKNHGCLRGLPETAQLSLF